MFPVIKAVMALILSVAFVIPAKGLPSPRYAPVSNEGCPYCLVIEEDAWCCEDFCCEPENQEDPCDGSDCECPHCPGAPTASTPLNAIRPMLPPQTNGILPCPYISGGGKPVPGGDPQKPWHRDNAGSWDRKQTPAESRSF